MIIIGNILIPYQEVFKVINIDSIKYTKANSLVYFEYDEELMSYSFKNTIPYMIKVKTIKEAIFANSLNATFIVIEELDLAKKVQDLAENYMFDSKVLKTIEFDNEIEAIALEKIDGVIYKNLLS